MSGSVQSGQVLHRLVYMEEDVVPRVVNEREQGVEQFPFIVSHNEISVSVSSHSSTCLKRGKRSLVCGAVISVVKCAVKLH